MADVPRVPYVIRVHPSDKDRYDRLIGRVGWSRGALGDLLSDAVHARLSRERVSLKPLKLKKVRDIGMDLAEDRSHRWWRFWG